MDLGLVFLTGLTVGGLSCMVVQGGLLTSGIATRKAARMGDTSFSDHALPVFSFLITKLLVYVALGFALGWVGKTLAFSDTARLIMQAVAGLYMLSVALYLLKV